MDLTYITERIISMCFPPDVDTPVFRANLKEAADMLTTKHGENYMVFNFSEQRRDVARYNSRVMEQGWPDDLAPPLERLCSICKSIDSWLNEHPHHIAVLLSRGGRERMGVVVAAYLHYSSICASADQALDRFAMKRFFDDKIGGLNTPSHKRYVNYFAGLLSGSIKINSDPLYLNDITVFGVPAYEPGEGCRSFVKVYQGMVPVYTSGVYTVTKNTRQFTIGMDKGLQLRGDILVKCYHKRQKPPSRDVIFRCQFHTCAVSDSTLAFSRQELDDACYDMRFPLDGGVELHFSITPDPRRAASGSAVPVDTSADPVTRWDSYERVDPHSEEEEEEGERESPVNHTLGPLDGSLYATVAKKSNSPVNAAPSRVTQVTVTPVQNGIDSLVNSPHTVSMDSGISSAGNSGQREGHLSGSSVSPPHSGQFVPSHGHAHAATTTVLAANTVVPNGHDNVNETDSGTSPNAVETRVEVHAAPKEPAPPVADHSQLDELLTGMLLDVKNIPDLKPSQKMPGVDIDVDSIKLDFDIPHKKTVVSKTYSVTTRNEYSSLNSGFPPSHGYSSTHVLNGCAPSSGRASDYLSEDSLNTTQDEGDIPYHARQDSRPFTYGIVSNTSCHVGQRKDLSTSNISSGPPSPSIHRRNSKETLSPTTTLQSPRLVRKISGGGGAEGHAVISRTPLPTVTSSQDDALSSPQLRRKFGLSSPSPTHSPSVSPTVPLVPVLTSSQRSPTSHSPLQRSISPSAIHPATLEESIMDVTVEKNSRYSENSMTWLQRQQKKLRERKEQQTRTERAPQESRLINELRSVQSRMPTCRDELEGYASDTTLLSDAATSREGSPSKYGISYSTPLHINTSGYSTYNSQQDSSQYTTSKPPIHSKGSSAPSSPILPSRSSSRDRTIRYNQYISGQQHQPLRPVGRQQSDTSHDRERPFMAVKRAHEQDRLKSDSTQIPSVSPQSLLAASPLGHIPYSSTLSTRTDGGLLTTVEGQTGHESSMSSWQTTVASEEPVSPRSTSPRPVTPAFPVQPRTPYVNQDSSPAGLPPKSPTTTRRSFGSANSSSFKNLRKWSSNSSVSSKDRSPSPATVQQIRAGLMSQPDGYFSAQPSSVNGQSTPASVYCGLSRRSSLHSNSMEPQEVSAVHVKFVRDTSKYWYKPNISREEAINLLRDKDPGTFVVRDSNSFPGAFGLALKVAKPPPNVQNKTGDASTELVRHFLIEPTTKGVKLKGCSNEPVFGSLSALVYQHSITPLALPASLMLPDTDPAGDTVDSSGTLGTAAQLLAQGAACSVLYLFTMDMESLTGPQAIKKAMTQLFLTRPLPLATIVHFKVSSQGITLTDSERRLFFRRHYPVSTISFCGLDPEDRRWSQKSQETGLPVSSNRCFGFVARKPASKTDNQCHLFAELEPEQPASAIVNFVTKVMMSGPSDKINIV